MKLTKIKSKFCNTGFYRYFWSAVMHPKNFIFLSKYPFWKCYNVWTRKFSGYQFTMYDWISNGWRKAFGPALTMDIAEALEKDNIPKRKWTENLQWQDIKQKYGTLRLYASTTKKVQDVLYKYEIASMCYCENCGKPARYVTHGWISYLCEDCFNAGAAKYGETGERLSTDYIPTFCSYDKDGNETQYTALERWGIDFVKMWGLEENK